MKKVPGLLSYFPPYCYNSIYTPTHSQKHIDYPLFLHRRKTKTWVPWTSVSLTFSSGLGPYFLFSLWWFSSVLFLCLLIFFLLKLGEFFSSLGTLVSNQSSLVFFKSFCYFKFLLPQSSVCISAFHLGHFFFSLSGKKTKEGITQKLNRAWSDPGNIKTWQRSKSHLPITPVLLYLRLTSDIARDSLTGC